MPFASNAARFDVDPEGQSLFGRISSPSIAWCTWSTQRRSTS